jgi:glycosyltransferase involved in cell wall biosynthesis
MCSNRKPKIALLSIRNSYNYGGVLSSLKTAYQFCERYFKPTVFFLSFDPALSTSLRSVKFSSSVRSISYFGMNCVEIGSRWAFWEPGHYRYTLNHWRNLLAEYNYFWAVSGTCIAAHPLALLNKKFNMWIGTPYDEDRAERVKLLTGTRLILDRLAHHAMVGIEKQVLERASYIWPVSTYAERQFQHILNNKPTNMEWCSYPMEQAASRSLNTQKEDIIIAVGRFSDPRKNIDMLIRVFDALYRKKPSLHLYVIGMKPHNEKLFDYSHLPSFANITFTGQVGSTDLHTLLDRAKLMLITSYQEGLGIVGLEALMHGTPVIATDCGGPRDYIIEGKTGFLVPINDDTAMVNQALTLLNTASLHYQFSLAGQHLIEQQFSLPKIHNLFKKGFCHTYPELTTWFAEYDRIRAEHTTNTSISSMATL